MIPARTITFQTMAAGLVGSGVCRNQLNPPSSLMASPQFVPATISCEFVGSIDTLLAAGDCTASAPQLAARANWTKSTVSQLCPPSRLTAMPACDFIRPSYKDVATMRWGVCGSTPTAEATRGRKVLTGAQCVPPSSLRYSPLHSLAANTTPEACAAPESLLMRPPMLPFTTCPLIVWVGLTFSINTAAET